MIGADPVFLPKVTHVLDRLYTGGYSAVVDASKFFYQFPTHPDDYQQHKATALSVSSEDGVDQRRLLAAKFPVYKVDRHAPVGISALPVGVGKSWSWIGHGVYKSRIYSTKRGRWVFVVGQCRGIVSTIELQVVSHYGSSAGSLHVTIAHSRDSSSLVVTCFLPRGGWSCSERNGG